MTVRCGDAIKVNFYERSVMFDIELKYCDIVKLWGLADAVYDEPEEGHSIFQDWDVISHVSMQNKLDYCLAIEYRSVLLFVFRGTDTKDAINEWECIKLIKRWASNLTVLPLVQNGVWGKGMFHHDMYDIFLKFKTDINGILSVIDPQKPIITVGHSRGGPPAVYLHRHLVKNLKRENTKCITFACPRHMTRTGVLESRMLGTRVVNFINGYDLITRIPKSLYRNDYDVYLKKISLNVFNFWFMWLFRGIRNHLQKAYTKTINKRYNDFSNRDFLAYDNHSKKKLIVTIK